MMIFLVPTCLQSLCSSSSDCCIWSGIR